MKMRTVIVSGSLGLTVALTGCGSGQATGGDRAALADTAGSTTTYPLKLDNCDAEVTYPSPPRRAVTLNQAAAEILIRLGVGDRVVGTGYQIDKIPDDVAAEYGEIPLLATNGASISNESLLGAQPDFVYSQFASFLTTAEAGERQELHDLEVPTYLTEFDCVSHESVAKASFDLLFDEYRDLATIFDVAAAGERLVAEQQAVVDAGVDTAKAIEGDPTVMWFYSTYEGTPYVAGPGGLPQHVTELVGARNVFDDASTKWPETSWDEVAARNPSVIVLADLTRGEPGDTAKEKIDILKKDPLTATLDAVRNDRFIVVPGQYMDPSAGSVQAVPALADGLVKLQ
jgi:iron complex transport system substrate-binding protein